MTDIDAAIGAQLAHRLAVLVETNPEHPLVLAVRLALEVADARRADHRALRQAALEVHGGDRQLWQRLGRDHVPHAELQRRRAEPGRLAPRRHPFLDRLAAAGLPVDPAAGQHDQDGAA